MDLKEFGRQFKEERLRQGLELTEVMGKTKISRVSLEAIEEGDERALPHFVYAKGFVKNYARFLGLDADKMGNAMAQIYTSHDDATSNEQLALTDARKLPAVKSGFPRHFLFLAAILFLVFAAACLWFFRVPLQQVLFPLSEQESLTTQPSSDVGRVLPGTGTELGATGHVFEEKPLADALDARFDDVPSPLGALPPASPEVDPKLGVAPGPVSDSPLQAPVSGVSSGDGTDGQSQLDPSRSTLSVEPSQQAPAPSPIFDVLDSRASAQESPVVKPQVPPVPVPGDRTMEIRAVQNCWLSAQADGGRIRDAFLRPDERLVVSFEKKLELKLGNAGGVELFLDGRPWPLQAKSGEVMVLRFP